MTKVLSFMLKGVNERLGMSKGLSFLFVRRGGKGGGGVGCGAMDWIALAGILVFP